MVNFSLLTLEEISDASRNGPHDDFEPMFEDTLTNILYLIWLMLLILMSTPFEILLVFYEKFGGDPMKRSLRNQLYAQTGYMGVLRCVVPTVLWTFRIFVGPISLYVVEVYYFYQQALSAWYVIHNTLCR